MFDNDIERHPEHYRPLNDYLDKVIERSFDPARIFKAPNKKQLLREFLVKNSTSEEKLVFIPIVGSRKDATLVLQKDTGEIMGIIDVIPWAN